MIRRENSRNFVVISSSQCAVLLQGGSRKIFCRSVNWGWSLVVPVLTAAAGCSCSVVQSREIISDNYPHNARVTAHVSRVYMHTYHCTRVTMHTCLLWVSWPRLAPRHIGLTAAFCCCSALIWANLVLRPATTTISITIPPSSQQGVVP